MKITIHYKVCNMGLTWRMKNPPTHTNWIVEFNISMKVFRVIKKEFYCRVTKTSSVIIIISKWNILIINWSRNGCITVIFKKFSPIPFPEIREWYGSYVTNSLRCPTPVDPGLIKPLHYTVHWVGHDKFSWQGLFV